MDRRRFLLNSLLGMGAIHNIHRSIINAHPSENKYDLAVVTGTDIPEITKVAIASLGGIERFVKEGNIVFLKPNVSFPNPPEWGTTTHPEVIRTVALLCMNAGAKRVIAADFPMSRPAQCFERSGMKILADTFTKLSFLELKEESQFEPLPIPDGQETKQVLAAKILLKADVFINLPKAKSHSATAISFGLKNLMGLFWNRMPFHTELNLHNAIVDLATVMRPHLTILDATYSLITNGPQGPGRIERLNTVIAGIDPVTVDSYGCALAEWNDRNTPAKNVAHLAQAAERGLGSLDLSQVKIIKLAL